MIKKLLYIVVIVSMLFYFRYAVLSLFNDTEVGGHKYVGLIVDGGDENGFSYLFFSYLYFEIEGSDVKPWVRCHNLNKSLEGYFRRFIKGWMSDEFEYWFVSESSPKGYRAYIRFNNKIVFVRGFPDFGGSPPSEREKRICENK